MSAVKQATISLSWGITPGTASIVLPGDQTADYISGDVVTVTVGSLSFTGIVRSSIKSVEGVGGWVTSISAVDNRLHWEREYVFAVFNQVEVREDNIATAGVDRQRRYKVIVPDGHRTQTAVYHDKPLTARQVFLYCLEDLTFEWQYQDHAALDQPLGALDANNGMTFAQILSHIANECGLLVGIEGDDTIVWARKGEGAVPSPPSGSESKSSGTSLSNSATKVHVVGDRAQYQANNVVLEPDWNPFWEDYILEADFLNFVEDTFGPFAADPLENAALRAAKARTVTLREFALEHGDDALDNGIWGEVSRNEIPAYVYRLDVVFKAYRIPATFELEPLWLPSSLTTDSLQLTDSGLLVAVDYDYDTGQMSIPATERKYFPADKAFVLVKGFNLSLVDPRGRKMLTSDQIAEAQDKWSPVSDFEIDVRPGSRSIVFGEQVFASSNLFLFPNNGTVPEGHPLHGMVVPNAAVTLGAAEVRAAVLWEGEKFFETFGTGPREEARYFSGLREQWVMDDAGVLGLEIPAGKDDSGEDVFPSDLAENYAQNLILREDIFATGFFTRYGSVGTALSGVIETVVVSLVFEKGLSETVTLAADKAPSAIFPNRFLEWNSRARDIFPGQESLRQEAWQLKTIASLKSLRRMPQLDRVKSIPDLLQRPLGAVDSGVNLVNLAAPVDAGTAVFTTGGGSASDSGRSFAGVVVAHNAGTAHVAVATQGVVPVKITGPFQAGDAISCSGGVARAGRKGIFIGTVAETFDGTGSVLAPVRLAAAESRALRPFECWLKDVSPSSGGGYDSVIYRVYEGRIFLSEDWEDLADVSGLTTTDLTLQQEGDSIWLELHQVADEPPSITLQYGAPWEDFPTMWKYVPPPSETADPEFFWYQKIAFLRAPRDGEASMVIGGSSLVLEQVVKTDLIVRKECVGSLTSYRVPQLLPWH
jgi:hypothetical protein